jgi:hypothetical protein
MTAANNLDFGGRPCSALCSNWNSNLRPSSISGNCPACRFSVGHQVVHHPIIGGILSLGVVDMQQDHVRAFVSGQVRHGHASALGLVSPPLPNRNWRRPVSPAGLSICRTIRSGEPEPVRFAIAIAQSAVSLPTQPLIGTGGPNTSIMVVTASGEVRGSPPRFTIRATAQSAHT